MSILPFNITNPGINISGVLTSIEAQFVTNLVNQSYVAGDILYHNGTQFLRLPIGTNTHVLTVTAGLPVWSAPSGGSSGHVIEDEGTPLTQRANMNFTGSGVTVTDAGGKTVVTIPGGGPGLVDGDYGDIVVSGTGTVMTIDTNVVGLNKLAQIATDSILGRATAATGNVEVLTALPFAFTGDVTRASDSNSQTIANSVVTLTKMADVATSTVFYRKTAGTGAPEVQTLATLKTDLGLTGTNSGDQTSIVGITGTKAQFDTAVTDGNFLYVGDITQYTDELAQDAVGAMATGSTFISFNYVDGTPSLTPALSATGTPSSSTFLRGDNIWSTVSGGNTFNDTYIDQSGGTSDTYGVLSGTINGSNALFTVSQGLYVTGALKVWLNGQLMTQGSAEDFVETTPGSGTFTFNTAPATGSLITVEYRKVVTNSDTIVTTTTITELAQDAVGVMVDASLTYVDGTPLLQRSALTGAITASAGSNTTALGSFTKAQLDTAVSDGNVLYVGDVIGLTDGDKGDITVSASGATWTVDNNAITLGKMATIATDSILGRATAAAGTVEVLTALPFAYTGDVTRPADSNATTIAAGVVTLAKQADVATATVFYRKTAGTGSPEVQTLATLKTDLGLTGTNSGDQTSIVGITGTKAQFNTAVTDGDILYVGDVTQYTDELAQDAIGAMIDTSLVYVDGTPLLTRAALTGAITASQGSNATSLGSFTIAQLNTAISDADVSQTGHTHTLANITDVTMTVANLNSLDDGVDSTLHFHATDRARANHTGTQLSSTISDFTETAQDSIGAMIDTTLTYVDGTPLLQRSALTGAITASAGSNATSLGSFTVSQLNTAISDGDIATGGGSATGTNTGDQNIFQTIAVSGQSNVVADSITDTLTLVAGTNVTITTDAGTDSITINASGGGGGVSDGDKGDIIVSGTGTVWTIDNGVVTFAKMQAITDGRLLGASGGTAVEEITVGSGLSLAANVLTATGGGGGLTQGQAVAIFSGYAMV